MPLPITSLDSNHFKDKSFLIYYKSGVSLYNLFPRQINFTKLLC